jgi:hypothetical protein
MNGYELRRREFIQVLLSLPLGYAVACAGDGRAQGQQSLGKLVLALGPWSPDDRELAEEFVRRFLAAEHIVGLYLPESSAVIQSLTQRFPEGAMSVGDVDLATLSAEEREFVVGFTQQLYSLVEVRFFVSNEPRWGVCLGERTRYTQVPR